MKRKILVFDDKDGIAGIVASIFSESDIFEVVVPESHFKGISLLQKQLFSIIVTDFEMPVMDGREFLKELRDENNPNRGVPILFVTEKRKEAKEGSHGMVKVYISDKPIIISELMILLKKATGEGF
jgi:CheY-like chemotaxis protein